MSSWSCGCLPRHGWSHHLPLLMYRSIVKRITEVNSCYESIFPKMLREYQFDLLECVLKLIIVVVNYFKKLDLVEGGDLSLSIQATTNV
jgi:hypothetical protein